MDAIKTILAVWLAVSVLMIKLNAGLGCWVLGVWESVMIKGWKLDPAWVAYQDGRKKAHNETVGRRQMVGVRMRHSEETNIDAERIQREMNGLYNSVRSMRNFGM